MDKFEKLEKQGLFNLGFENLDSFEEGVIKQQMDKFEKLEKQGLFNLGLESLDSHEKGVIKQGDYQRDYVVSNYWIAYIEAFFKFSAVIMVVKDEAGNTHATVTTGYVKKNAQNSSFSTSTFGKEWEDPLIQYLSNNNLLKAYNIFNNSLIFDGIECRIKLQITGISMDISLNLEFSLNPEILVIRQMLKSVITQIITTSQENNIDLIKHLEL